MLVWGVAGPSLPRCLSPASPAPTLHPAPDPGVQTSYFLAQPEAGVFLPSLMWSVYRVRISSRGLLTALPTVICRYDHSFV